MKLRLTLITLIITAAVATGLEASSESKTTASASQQETKQAAGQAVTTICAKCNKTGKDFKRCGRCRAVNYCSPDCQKADWKRHKEQCAAAQETAQSLLKAIKQRSDYKAHAFVSPNLDVRVWVDTKGDMVIQTRASLNDPWKTTYRTDDGEYITEVRLSTSIKDPTIHVTACYDRAFSFDRNLPISDLKKREELKDGEYTKEFQGINF